MILAVLMASQVTTAPATQPVEWVPYVPIIRYEWANGTVATLDAAHALPAPGTIVVLNGLRCRVTSIRCDDDAAGEAWQVRLSVVPAERWAWRTDQ